jgi:glutathione S-transferase
MVAEALLMAIKLYDLAGAEEDRRFSPYCWRVKMALKHKGLEFETIPWRFTETDALAFSGQKLVPVIVDGGQSVHDSFRIAEYLDEAYPSRPGLFGGSEGHSLSMFLSNWAVRTVHAALSKVVILDLYGIVHEKDKAYFRESREKRFGMPLEQVAADPKKALADFRATLEPLRPVLLENQYLSGKGPGFADYILFGPFQWARSVSPIRLLEQADPLYAWRERVLELFGGYARQSKGYPG